MTEICGLCVGPERSGGCHALVTFLLVAGAAAQAHAQSILVPSVEYAEPVPTVEQASSTLVGSVPMPTLRRSEGLRAYPLEVGMVRFDPHLAYQFMSGNGILRTPGDARSTTLHTISPGVQMELGSKWIFDFTPTLTRYGSTNFSDTTDYAMALRGTIPTESWLFQFGYRGAFTEQPRIETGTQTSQNSHSVNMSGTYHPAGRVSYEFGLSQDFLITEGFSDVLRWSTMDWINYAATPKTSFGLGAGGGYNVIAPGPDSVFGQMQGRWGWLPSRKLSFQTSAGFQVQKFEAVGGGRSPVAVFPTLAVSGVYRVFDPTTLSLFARRDVGNSYLADVFTETTAIGGGINQRLLTHLSFIGRGSYEITQYRGITSGTPQSREDKYWLVYTALGTVLFKKITLSAFHQFSSNHSSSAGLSFDSQQSGLRVEYRY